ncbi:MAG: hypothetical protein JWR07_526 [Nevskia sp.]|nr:hypothetical protein [Nevskia sp.]
MELHYFDTAAGRRRLKRRVRWALAALGAGFIIGFAVVKLLG